MFGVMFSGIFLKLIFVVKEVIRIVNRLKENSIEFRSFTTIMNEDSNLTKCFI